MTDSLHLDDLDNAPCGFLKFADNGSILAVNQTFVDLLGHDNKASIVGSNIEKLFSIASRIFYQTHFYPLLNLHGQANEIFFNLKTKTGGDLPVICNATRKAEADGFATRCIFIPIVERGKYEQEILAAKRQAEEALQKNDALLQAKQELETNTISLDRKLSQLKQINEDIIQFSMAISHEVQEPIRKIAIISDKVVVQSQDILPPEKLEELQKLNKECRRLRNLVANLERFISLNTESEKFTQLDLNTLISQTLQECAEKYGISPEVEIKTLQAIEGYPRQIKLLFTNIFDNSFKYRDEDRPLHIAISGKVVEQNAYRAIRGKYRYIEFLQLTISDNGKGLDNQADSRHIFQLRKQSGQLNNFGFGLALCKKIVDNHFGSIRALSAPDKGTEITIMLPLTQE